MTIGWVNYLPAAGPGRAIWPAADKFVSTEELGSHLRHVGRLHARSALRKSNSGLLHKIEAAIAAGSAIELLLRAILALRSVSLIADKGDLHTVLMLSDQTGATQKDGYKDARSLQATECLRAIKNIPDMPNLADTKVQLILTVRNAAAHMGLVADADLEEALGCLVDVVASMLPKLGWSASEFWGHELEGFAGTLNESQRDERKVRVERAKLDSKRAADRLKSHIDPFYWDEFVDQAQMQLEPSIDEDLEFAIKFECPACKEEGWLSGTAERVIHVYVDNMHDTFRTVEKVGHPEQFDCGVCSLSLSGLDLSVLGLDKIRELGEEENAPELDQFSGESDLRIEFHRPG